MSKIRFEGLDKQGLDKLRYKGLSINKFTRPATGRQIDKAICRQIDKPQYAQYHQNNGLSRLSQYVRRFQTTVYKRYNNIPSNRQTISSGYKGLDNMLDIRFEGLIYA